MPAVTKSVVNAQCCHLSLSFLRLRLEKLQDSTYFPRMEILFVFFRFDHVRQTKLVLRQLSSAS